MISHAPQNYACPFCALVNGARGAHVLSTEDDIVLRTPEVTAFVASHQWPKNVGHVLVIPNSHYENLFDLPLHLAVPLHRAVTSVATAMKLSYQCDGITIRQHNEPCGGQDVWHYHVHVFPRYREDHFYSTTKALTDASSRSAYAMKLRAALAEIDGRHSNTNSGDGF